MRASRLERTEASVEEINWQVGYEEPAFFRRLFKRGWGHSPCVCRVVFRFRILCGRECGDLKFI